MKQMHVRSIHKSRMDWKGEKIDVSGVSLTKEILESAKDNVKDSFVPYCHLCFTTGITFKGKGRYICNNPNCVSQRAGE